MVDMASLALLLLLPCSALAGGSVSVSVKDLGAVVGLESLNIQGSYDHPVTEKITGKASYVFNKDRTVPASVGAATITDTKLGTLFSTIAVDPQEKSATVETTLRSEDYGVFSTSYKAKDKAGVLGPLRWTSKPLSFPFALKEPTPMVIGIMHDVKTKEGQLNFSARLSNNLDGKLVLPSAGDLVATVIASHSPDKDSDVRASASVLDLLGSGIGKGAIGVTYRRDLETVPGSSSRVTLEGKDTGDFAWSLSNTTKRMTLVLSGRGRLTPRGAGEKVASTVSLRSSFRLF